MTIQKNTIISLKFVNFRPKIYLIAYPSFVNLTTYIAIVQVVSDNIQKPTITCTIYTFYV